MSRRSDSGLNGILLVDKPKGWTSHDVVAKARGLTGQRRIGHSGTLDPMATGLLVLCLGKATRLVEYLMGHDKRYTGTIRLGAATATDDSEGEVLAAQPVPEITRPDLEAALQPFRGEILQRPPAFSALKVSGVRAYKAARRGDPMELAPRRVVVHSLDARITGPETIALDVTCSSGTYIRSLARDIGEALGCGGHLSALRRHASGPFSVDHASSIEQLEAIVRQERLGDVVWPSDEAILEMEAALLGQEGTDAVAHGRPWQAPQRGVRASFDIRIYDASGEFVGVGSLSDSGEIRAKKVFIHGKTPK